MELAALGWTEKTEWESGLKRTIDWYLQNGFGNYWEHGDVEVQHAAAAASICRSSVYDSSILPAAIGARFN